MSRSRRALRLTGALRVRPDVGDRHAGTLGGAMNMVGNLGGALGAVIAGSLMGKAFGSVAGNDLVFVVFAGSFWLAALCWLGVDATRPLSAAEERSGR